MREQIHQHVLFSSTRQIGQWFPTHTSPATSQLYTKLPQKQNFSKLQPPIFPPRPSIFIDFKGSVNQPFHFDPSFLLYSRFPNPLGGYWRHYLPLTSNISALLLCTRCYDEMGIWGGGGVTSFNSHNNLVRWILISMFLRMRKFSNFPKVTSVMRDEDNT